MIDLSFYRENGFQVIKNLLPVEKIRAIRHFLEAEKEKNLHFIRPFISFDSYEKLIGKITEIFNDEAAFQALDINVRNILSGHFSLETRLNPIFHHIPRVPLVREICAQIFPNQDFRLHLPPTARFIIPNNAFAAVPAHQDVSYNKHVENFFVLWVPYCDINEECGGVIVHKGTGQLPEQLTQLERKFWLQGIPDLGYEKIHCTMNEGDVLLLNKWVIHESAKNTSDKIRYSSDFRFFCGASLKHYLDMQTWEIIDPSAALLHNHRQ